MTRSRLTRRVEQKTKRNLFLSVLGIILVIFLVFKFGIPLLVNVSLFLSGAKNNQEQVQNQNPAFIAPPILNPLPQATSSANIIISGIGAEDQEIHLYINDELIDKTETENDGRFSFEEKITPGEKTIKAKSVVDDKESEFSQPITTALKSAPPSLTITSPSDGQSFSKDQNSANVEGTTDPDVRVTVNGFWAITDSIGNFTYRLLLQSGENKIKIVATDIAGNKSEKEIRVNYSP